jgi:hypothetical protein
VDVRLGTLERSRDGRECFSAVEQHLQLVPWAGLRFPVGPCARGRGRVKGGSLTEPLQASPVVGGDQPLKQAADLTVGGLGDAR